jgi:hypothetical protein
VALGERRGPGVGLVEEAVDAGLALTIDEWLEVPGRLPELWILECGGCRGGGDVQRLGGPGPAAVRRRAARLGAA